MEIWLFGYWEWHVTLFPIHDIVFSSQCANLTKPPTATKVDVSANIIEPHLTIIPVVPLAIPSPQTFPQLAAYLYTHSTLDLLTFLLPTHAAGAHLLHNKGDEPLLTPTVIVVDFYTVFWDPRSLPSAQASYTRLFSGNTHSWKWLGRPPEISGLPFLEFPWLTPSKVWHLKPYGISTSSEA